MDTHSEKNTGSSPTEGTPIDIIGERLKWAFYGFATGSMFVGMFYQWIEFGMNWFVWFSIGWISLMLVVYWSALYGKPSRKSHGKREN